MKVALLLSVCFICGILALPQNLYGLEACSSEKCKLPDCQCSQVEAPNTGGTKNPQLVMLSFDDAAAKLIYENMWEKILFDSKNPDGCPISATFFVPHQYSDYEVVSKLYNKGFEIASHSISKNVLSDYWRNATKDVIVAEMGGQREILSHFANVPKEAIIGARIPMLQINPYTFEALKESGFEYDSSWPTRQHKPLFPYTLDYESIQACEVAQNCHTESVPGLWEFPIIDFISPLGIPCNSLMGCYPQGNATEIFEWMKKNFEVIYKNNKAPVSIIVDYGWFSTPQEHQDALKKFMDYLLSSDDIYLVSHRLAWEWAKDPTKPFNSCTTPQKTDCQAKSCKLQLGDSERYMTSCVECPKNYPWLDNPLGK